MCKNTKIRTTFNKPGKNFPVISAKVSDTDNRIPLQNAR